MTDEKKTDGASLLPVDPSASPASTEPLPERKQREHCWHLPEPCSTYSNGWETSTEIRCCWCGSMGFRITRRIGRDTVKGHGPHYTEPVSSERIEIRFGEEACSRSMIGSGNQATNAKPADPTRRSAAQEER